MAKDNPKVYYAGTNREVEQQIKPEQTLTEQSNMCDIHFPNNNLHGYAYAGNTREVEQQLKGCAELNKRPAEGMSA
jgi:hypothetical protein